MGWVIFWKGVLAQAVEPALFGAGIISGPLADAAPAFSPDGQTVYFHRSGVAMNGTILVSRCLAGVWSRPEVAVFSGQWQDIEPVMSPAVTADESFIVFSSKRAPAKTMELFIDFRKGGVWGEPTPLGPDVNRGVYSIESRLSPDEQRLYFSSVWAPKPAVFGEAGSGKRALERNEWETGLLNLVGAVSGVDKKKQDPEIEWMNCIMILYLHCYHDRSISS